MHSKASFLNVAIDSGVRNVRCMRQASAFFRSSRRMRRVTAFASLRFVDGSSLQPSRL
jgi:hypothetical protein